MHLCNIFLRTSAAASLLALVALLPACATFDAQWKAAADTPAATAPAPPTTLTGRWQGKWTSLNHDTSDALRCVFTPLNRHTSHAVFQATFKDAFYFDHSVNLETKPTPTGFSFHGREDNPWFKGGKCYFTGQCTGDQIHMTYLDNFDHGTFDLTRIK